ncbi:MAG: flagellar basal body rod protein FlgB [Acidobacteria bacterium]|nr:flagellar basal body rod protein FlgB [Acidobacteriota bacterium]
MELLPADNITNLLQSFMDVQTRRAQVIAGNIANTDTPGYVAKDLDFENYLREAAQNSQLPLAKQTNQSDSELKVVDQPSEVIGLDGNTVDMGSEMAKMAQTGTNFNFGAKMLQSRLRLLRTAIKEGR